MPVIVHGEIQALTQEEFGRIAYEVMECIFELHGQLGPLCDEEVYKRGIVACLPHARPEVQIEVRHGGFRKDYFIDLVVAPGAVFELKWVEKLHDRHQAQLLNYLMLSSVRHGKLVNLRSDRVEHVFVNTTLTRPDRTDFALDSHDWQPTDAATRQFPLWMEEAVRDWGTCLDRWLYLDAAIHFFGGEERVMQPVEVSLGNCAVAHQTIAKANPDSGLQITTLNVKEQASYAHHLHRFLDHTTLAQIHWANIDRRMVTFKTMRRDA